MCESWCWLQIQDFKFLGPAKAIQWAENAVKKVIQRVKHCKKQFFKDNMSFYMKIIFVPPSAFGQKVHLGHEKNVRLTTVCFIIVCFIEIFS